MMKYLFALFLSLLLLSCDNKSIESELNLVNNSNSVDENGKINKNNAVPKEDLLIKINNEILSALNANQIDVFSNYIHPTKGVKFSMYAFVNKSIDRHFTKEDFIKNYPSNTVFSWGFKDGTGEEYKTSIQQYFKDWVLKKDFSKSQFSVNTFIGGGNTLNNLKEIYPEADFTENFVEGTQKYGEMDWRSLRFVFEKEGDKYYIIAVINDEWTG